MKIWEKIAQQTGAPATSQPSTPTTAPSTTSVPAPPTFNPISGPWAWLARAYNAPSVRELAYLLNMVHVTLHYASNGKYNLLKNQNNINSIDPSGATSVDAKNLILLAQLFYKFFLNNGQPFTPTASQISTWSATIKNSQPLINLSQLNPTGQAAQTLRLGGTFRQTMSNHLDYLTQYNLPQSQPAR